MKLRSNKGFTGIDISVAVIIMLIFVVLITTLFYSFSVSSKNVERRSEANYLSIQIIEAIKTLDYGDIPIVSLAKVTKDGITDIEETQETEALRNKILNDVGIKEGYTATVQIQTYKDYINSAEELEDVIKIVTVQVEYTVEKTPQAVEIRTAIIKEV